MAPGSYVPDRTEGITRVEDLPPPLLEQCKPWEINGEHPVEGCGLLARWGWRLLTRSVWR